MRKLDERVIEARLEQHSPVLLYGGPGCGKSTLAYSLRRVAVVDTDDLVFEYLARVKRVPEPEVWNTWGAMSESDKSDVYTYVKTTTDALIRTKSRSLIVSNLWSLYDHWDYAYWNLDYINVMTERHKRTHGTPPSVL